MKLRFIDVNDEYQNVLIDILNDLNIKISHTEQEDVVKYASNFFGFCICNSATDYIEVDTDYEKFEYAKFLFNKKVKEIKKLNKKKQKDINYLENCLTKKTSTKKNKKNTMADVEKAYILSEFIFKK